MSKDQLQTLIKEAASHKVNLSIHDAQYGADGKLEQITGGVVFADGASGTFTSDRLNRIVMYQGTSSMSKETGIKVKHRIL